MADDFKNEDMTPVLTLDPFGSQDSAQVPAEQKKEPLAEMTQEYVLTPDEQKMVDSLAKQIDLRNSTMVLEYGAGTQKKMADFSDSALEKVRTKDLGEVGELLTDTMQKLKDFDDDEEQKGFFGRFKKSANKLENMKAKYASAEANINNVVKQLNDHQITLLKDAATMDKMYDTNLLYFKELSMYIVAGKQKLEEVRSTELPQLVEKAQKSGLPEDAQEANDLESMCSRFEKKLHDLELTRIVSIQMAPQIRLVQSNDTQMAEKIQSTVVNTIPLWKSQMTIALGMEHSLQAAAAQREVTDMTNALLKKNAEKLKIATVETAKEAERGIVDIETLKQTNETLISTFDEVLTIQREGRQKRAEAEKELRVMEDELKQKLLTLK